MYEKLLTVIEAGIGNFPADTDLMITTRGHDPSCSITIGAGLLKKFLKNKVESVKAA